MTLIAFGWPLCFFFITNKRTGRRLVWILYIVELLLAGGTIYWLHLFTAFGDDWLYGAYVVCAAIGIYSITTLILLINRFRKRSNVVAAAVSGGRS